MRRRRGTGGSGARGGTRRPNGPGPGPGTEGPADPQPDDARFAAVALLARRDFAVGELRGRLEADGFAAEAIAAALADLAAGGILDDARYAAQYVSVHAERGQGPRRVAADLGARGVSREIIEAALATEPNWAARAREVRIRRFGLAAPASWAEKGRQARFLQYRGFSSDHIRSAIGPDFDPEDPT